MPQRYYKQSVNRFTNGWSYPQTTTDPLWQMWSRLKEVRWRKVRKSAMHLCHNEIPFAINKIWRWHRNRGHSIVRIDRVYGLYRTTYMMVTFPKKKSDKIGGV